MDFIKSALRDAKERFVAFRERTVAATFLTEIGEGYLTPEEFVAAGDALVGANPTWQWSGGDEGKQKSFLPASKQVLVSRGVPCLRRATERDAMISAAADGAGATGLTGGDWVQCAAWKRDARATGIAGTATTSGGIITLGDVYEQLSLTTTRPSTSTATGARVNEPFDPAADYGADPMGAGGETANAAGDSSSPASSFSGLRRYDLIIAYDTYWRTPVVYLRGHTPGGRPLTVGEMFQDISQLYVQDTATEARLPHSEGGEPCLRIHPCKHAAAMKTLLMSTLFADGYDTGSGSKDQLGGRFDSLGRGVLSGGGSGMGADDSGPGKVAAAAAVAAYMPAFLKLVSSMMPTIDYDFTAGAEM